jgi:glyoxylase-like metal-dependent hydrolase (beta-lactamase superfamily II)
MTHSLTVTRFAAPTASVNSWIVSNGQSALIIDALRSEEEAAALADAVEASAARAWAVFVTHGHPDHYVGLRVLTERFPGIRVLVASRAVKDDIIAFTRWMDEAGWLEALPRLKIRSADRPDGFDYEGKIEILDGSRISLPGGGDLDVDTNYPAVEAAHMTTLHAPGIGALFTADLVYNGVHAWLGQGVTRESAAHWLQAVSDLKARFAGEAISVHPGHGPAGHAELFDRMQLYLTDFLAAADASTSNAEMTTRLTSLYPTYQQADFLLAYSVQNFGPDGRVAPVRRSPPQPGA